MTGDDLIRQAAIEIPEEDLRDIVCRIVDAADPEKIVLFGSAARGTMGPHSDLDLLVIKDGEYDLLAMTQLVYRALSGLSYAKDVIVATPGDIERYKDSYCLVYYPALRDGKVIYDRALQPGRSARVA
jgi:predicted nucleotidyltransferase